MQKIFSLLLMMSIISSSFAQSAGRISGSIKDGGNQQVIDASAISLLKASDSTLVKTSVTDKDGNFSFENIKEGSYIVMATSMGHSKVYSQPLVVSAENANINTGVLQLIPVTKSLKEVVVATKKPFIERKLDKTILNVEASITNTGSTALEVLEKAPGVSVDKDGNISLKGKAGVIIMMDGKPTYMSGQDLTNFLRNMPSSNLDQIEIMTNPSSKYDASGNSGIINIKTKKQKQVGFNGSLSTAYGQGVYAKTNNSLNLNYRVGKINVFSTLSGNYRENFEKLDIHRRLINPDKTTRNIIDQQSNRKRYRNFYNAKLGMDYYLSKKTTLGFVLNGYVAPGMESGFNTSYLKNSLGIVDSIVTADSREKSDWDHGGINVNIRHTFDSTGREITADVDYLKYSSGRDQHFVNNTYEPDWSLKNSSTLTGQLPSDIDIYSAKVDYTHPFKKGLKFETGFKVSFVSTDNIASYYNITGGVQTPDYEKTNQFQYKENLNAGYVNFSKTIKKWGFQAGLRAENTNYRGHQFGNAAYPDRDSSFKKSYTNLFPTAYVSYDLNEKNQFGFSYGRRISRPDYEDLNPFLSFLDKYTYDQGNPYLRPMYSNVFELSHTYKQFLTTTLNYSRTTDLFNETFRQEGFATIVSEGNYGLVDNVSLSISAQVDITKWWKSMLYGEGRYQRFQGMIYGEPLDVNGNNMVANVNNQFTFKNGWGGELSGFYRTKGIEGQMVIKNMSMLNAGVQKQILKKKGTLKLTVRDILQGRVARGNINFNDTEASFRQESDNRVATLSFTYRFGKPIKGLKKRNTGGAGDEQNRVKTAN